MILRLLHPGSGPSGPLGDVARDYQTRLKRHLRVEERYVRPSRSRGGNEASKLLASHRPGDLLVALDVGGKPLSSEALASQMQGWMTRGVKVVHLAVGAAEGLSEEVLQRADLRWSLGAATLPHDLAMVVMWEQLYRGLTIIRGEPYHKG